MPGKAHAISSGAERKRAGRLSAVPRPFLKWVGGKGQLLEELRQAFLEAQEAAGGLGRYHEPFVGGGAFFFDLHRRELLDRKKAFLSDNNGPLVRAYQGVQEDVDAVIRLLEAHKAAHGHDHYYEVRAALPETLAEQTARIIYLNKTCFNGLYRENSKGLFNVPIGRYKNPPICDTRNLRGVAEGLQRAKVEQRSFDTVLKHAKKGDFVYFDPPYHPVSATANFTAYNKGGFGEDGQRALAHVYRELDERGVYVMLSNSMTPLVHDLYAGFQIDTVHATRNVNSRADRRGRVPEALVRNF